MDSSVKEVKLEVEWKVITDVPITGPFYTLMNYATEPKEEFHKCQLTVFVQGDLENVCPLGELKHELVILTVHDVGTNPLHSFVQFAKSSAMDAIRQKKAVFLHVCVPGQEPGAKDFSGIYPTTSQLAEMLPQVLDHFGISRCIAIGEGAGADIVYRFAFNFPEMVIGAVLIHCTSTPHGIVENLKEIFANLRIEEGKMSDSAWEYLMAHKFGKPHNAEAKKQHCELIRALGLNEHNLSLYLHAFANREDLNIPRDGQKFDSVLVTGGKSPHNKNVFHMFDQMDMGKTGLVVAENAVDILQDAPEYLAEALNVFCARHSSACVHQPAGMFTIEPCEMATEQKVVERKISSERGMMENGGGGGRTRKTSANGLPKPATHPEKPAILTTTNDLSQYHQTAPVNNMPSLMQVPVEKPTRLIGFGRSPAMAAVEQNPTELLPGKYQGGETTITQNPADLLPGQFLKVEEPMSKCASTASQLSGIFQCQHCGRECCWCQELPPGSPLE